MLEDGGVKDPTEGGSMQGRLHWSGGISSTCGALT